MDAIREYNRLYALVDDRLHDPQVNRRQNRYDIYKIIQFVDDDRLKFFRDQVEEDRAYQVSQTQDSPVEDLLLEFLTEEDTHRRCPMQPCPDEDEYADYQELDEQRPI